MSQQIEDTGLTCPWCGYNVTSLTKPTCPECGKQFVLAKPGAVDDVKHKSFQVSDGRSMICSQCGHHNRRFMPARCAMCKHRFSWLQRIFGTNPFRWS